MDWKKQLNDQNKRLFSFPAGWWKAEEIAAQVGCSAEKVKEHFSPSIKDGSIEAKQHVVWNPQLERKEYCWGFRPTKPAKATPPQHEEESDGDLVGRTVFGRNARGGSPRKGVILSEFPSSVKIQWSSGNVTTPSKAGFKKGDLKFA